MKKILFLCLVLMSFVVTACLEEDNHGFPRKVNFPKEGGTIIVMGEGTPTINFINNNGDTVSHWEMVDSGDSLNWISRYQWISMKREGLKPVLELTAEPNTTHKKRSARIDLWFFDSFGEIRVSQSK